MSPGLVRADEGDAFGKGGPEELVWVDRRGHGSKGSQHVRAAFDRHERDGPVFTRDTMRAPGQGLPDCLLGEANGTPLSGHCVRVGERPLRRSRNLEMNEEPPGGHAVRWSNGLNIGESGRAKACEENNEHETKRPWRHLMAYSLVGEPPDLSECGAPMVTAFAGATPQLRVPELNGHCLVPTGCWVNEYLRWPTRSGPGLRLLHLSARRYNNAPDSLT